MNSSNVKRINNAVVIVTSDTCFRDNSKDISGAFVAAQLKRTNLFARVIKYIRNDDRLAITSCVQQALDQWDPSLIVTVGGTGLCPRDVTPEATSFLYDKHCSGIVSALHSTGLSNTPFAALSRLTAGIKRNTLIINFPGSLNACKDCFSCLNVFLKHALQQVQSDLEAYTDTHRQLNQVAEAKCDESSSESGSLGTRERAHSTSISTSTFQSCTDTIVGKNSQSKYEISTKDSESYESSNLNSVELTTTKSTDTNGTHESKRNDIVEQDQKRKPFFNSESDSSTTVLQKRFQECVKVESRKILLTESLYPTINYDDALEILSSLSYSLLDGNSQELVLNSYQDAIQCLGSVLAEDLKPKCIVPPSAVSTMDGYALNIPREYIHDSAATKSIPNVKVLKDLSEFEELKEDSDLAKTFFCYQVNTGGKLPRSNYAVIPAEKASLISKKGYITVHDIQHGKYVRRAGSDLNEKDIIKAGTIIGHIELSLIMAMRHKTIKTFRRPTLGILSTGDELVDFFATTTKLNDSESVVDINGPLLTSFFQDHNYKVMNFGIARDNLEDILLKISESLEKCEILLITGGASMGTKDYVKEVIEQMGGTIHFGRVNIKPGKPAAFASIVVGTKRKFIFSLPGNPVSAYVTSLVLVMPFLDHGVKNHIQADLPITLKCIGDPIKVKVGELVDGNESYIFEGRLEFVRAKLYPVANYGKEYIVTISVKQQSSRMLNLKDCDCLVLIDPSLKGSKFLVGQTYPALKLYKKY